MSAPATAPGGKELPPRPTGQRILIWLLRRWWALAIVSILGALSSQFSGIAQNLLDQIVAGQPLSLPAIQTSAGQTVFAQNPVRGGVVLGIAVLITIVAFFAEQTERRREQHAEYVAAAVARDARRTEVRTDTREVLQEFFKEQAAQSNGLASESDDEEGETGSGRRPIVLPPRPALVIGRDAELARIAAALGASGARAVALRGMGGVGKSTLLLETMHRQAAANAYPGGIIWLACQDLIGDDGAAQIYDAAGVALGVPAVGKVESTSAKAAALRRDLSGRALLIALDNVEAQLPLDQVIATLTSHNTQGIGPVVLLTTRVNWPDISGLVEIDLDVLAPEQGFTLLQQLVARNGQELAGDDAEAGRAIVAAVGALPLALELVAPRIVRRAEPLVALAHRLHAEGVQLKGRTRGIERTFDLTYDQLAPNEQASFSALAVFSGPSFSQAAALAAMAALDANATSPHILLDLADLSLVREVPQPDGAPRYQVHPLLRQFGRDKLRARGEAAEQTVELATARFYRAAVHKLSRRWTDGLAGLEPDYPNILGALTWAYGQIASPVAELSTESAHLVGDLSAELRGYLTGRGYWNDARRVLRWGVEADSRLGNQRRESSQLASLAFIVRQQGDLDEAERYYQQALAITRARHDRHGEAARIHNLGTVALNRGDLARARSYYEAALALRRNLTDEAGASATLRSLGVVAAEQGQWEVARNYLREALDSKKSPGVSRARTYTELGSVLLRDPKGDRDQARKLLDAALETARLYHLRYDEARALDWLGALDLADGDIPGARQQWEAALRIYGDLGAANAQPVRTRLAKIAEVTPVPVAAGSERA